MLDLRNIDWFGYQSGTSIGMLKKAVVDVDGGVRYYLKMSSYNEFHGVYGIESISEVLASRLADVLGIPCVRQELVQGLVRLDGNEFVTYLCKSRDYKQLPDGRFLDVLPLGKYFEANRLSGETPLDFVLRCGLREPVSKMFFFDYLINNLDRHDRNIEVFMGRGGDLKMSPLFDHGLSLYSTVSETRIEEVGGERFYIGNDMEAGNFIGKRSLIANVRRLPLHKGELPLLVANDRQKLFDGMGDVISRRRRNAIWNLIVRRYKNVQKIYNS